MAKADRAGFHSETAHSKQSYAKRMCGSVAWALVAYTAMLIFVTSPAMDKSQSIFPYFLLVLLVGVVIMPLRNMEKRWQALEQSELSEASLESRFAVDLTKLWVAAIGLPIIYSIIIRALTAAF